jgi:4-hydroxybenzoate polyprenyltransferase
MNVAVYIRLVRPTQWLKNLLIFFPPFLGGTLFHTGAVSHGMIPFISFSLASSSTYIVNDIFDRENDANHPVKKERPIPSGLVQVAVAYPLSAVFFLCSLALGLTVSKGFSFLILAYFVIQLFYTIKLKEIPIVDIFCISAGFLLRLQAGGVIYGITVSKWLFLSVFLLSVFLSTGKRLGEMKFLGNNAGSHRISLSAYPAGFLDGVMYMTGGTVLVTYSMFVISRHALVLTVPLCCFGLLRYIFRVKSGLSGDPTEALLKDGILLIVSVLWAVMVWYGVYLSS